MRRMPVLVAGLVVVASVIYAGAAELIGPSTISPRYVIAAAGDIACDNAAYGRSSPSECQYDDTARLIDDPNLTAVLTLGDNQYETWSYDAYTRYFDPTWGRALDNLKPAPGNHEYGNDPSATPSGYFRYFGRSVKGPDGLGYYSYDLGACPDPHAHLRSGTRRHRAPGRERGAAGKLVGQPIHCDVGLTGSSVAGTCRIVAQT